MSSSVAAHARARSKKMSDYIHRADSNSSLLGAVNNLAVGSQEEAPMLTDADLQSHSSFGAPVAPEPEVDAAAEAAVVAADKAAAAAADDTTGQHDSSAGDSSEEVEEEDEEDLAERQAVEANKLVKQLKPQLAVKFEAALLYVENKDLFAEAGIKELKDLVSADAKKVGVMVVRNALKEIEEKQDKEAAAAAEVMCYRSCSLTFGENDDDDDDDDDDDYDASDGDERDYTKLGQKKLVALKAEKAVDLMAFKEEVQKGPVVAYFEKKLGKLSPSPSPSSTLAQSSLHCSTDPGHR
jgi:hypothetical protein